MTVAASGLTPTGAVAITQGGATVGRGTLSGGTATVAVSATALKPGTAKLVATYAGSTHVVAGSSVQGTVKVAKAKASATNKLSPSTVKAAARARLTVTVKAAGTVPTGKVTVYDGSKVIATGTLKAGKVVVTLPKLKRGSHKIHATYAGSTLVGTASAATVVLKVTR